jgi:hypothetical protein
MTDDVVFARVCQRVQGGLVKAQHRPCAQTDGVMIAWLCACAPGGGGGWSEPPQHRLLSVLSVGGQQTVHHTDAAGPV